MVHELRIYTAAPGRLPALLDRFRDHTLDLFEQHGIRNVVYWLNSIGGPSDELWYVVEFDSLAHREAAWAAFREDPAWAEVKAASEVDGPLVTRIENRILEPTDFSPLRP